MAKKKTPDYLWRVTSTEGGVSLDLGPELSDAPYDDDAKLHVVGEALIRLGTRLMGSTIREDDDEWED